MILCSWCFAHFTFLPVLGKYLSLTIKLLSPSEIYFSVWYETDIFFWVVNQLPYHQLIENTPVNIRSLNLLLGVCSWPYLSIIRHCFNYYSMYKVYYLILYISHHYGFSVLSVLSCILLGEFLYQFFEF